MADISCAVCLEAWDAYGIFHGENMSPWEKDLFLAAAGCPDCRGHEVDGIDPAEARLIQAKEVGINGAWDDPHVFASVNEPVCETRPKWFRPEDPVVFSCSCGNKIRRNLDEVLISQYLLEALYWDITSGSIYSDRWDTCLKDCFNPSKQKILKNPPANWTIDGEFYCPDCVENCGDCGELNFSKDLLLPEGKYHDGDAICPDCCEKILRCGECGCEAEELDNEGRGPCCASEESGDYLYSSVEECKKAEDHLADVDEDGYCKKCGNQDETE